MSYILEALRKSERERSLGKVPTLSTTTTIARSSRSMGWVAAILLFTIGLVVWGVWFYHSAPTTVVSSPAVPLSADRAESGVPAPIRNEQVHNDITGAGAAEPAPRIESVGNTVKLNVISWSADQGRRFAMINQKIFREGDDLAPGMSVRSIQTDKVILVDHGRELILKP